MKIALICVAATVGALLLLTWVMTQVHYRIGSRHLKIILWGIPLRKIPLVDIQKVSKRKPKGAAEYWLNTLKPSHRFLSIERSNGFRKFICISPSHRYVFMGGLKAAARRLNPSADLSHFSDIPEAAPRERPGKATV
ncbi:MAG: hypothetical protein ACO1QB_16070 [Verrucomicrobiales bacterium]